MKLEERLFKASKTVVVKPAHYKTVKTGEKREYVIIDEKGNRQNKQEDVTIKEYVEAELLEKEIELTRWCVISGDDVHEFLTKAEAKDFIKANK